MASFSSTQYTIGTALERAREAGNLVEVLVGNQWIHGMVVASDGLGVVLESDGLEHCVIRLDGIAAVRVAAGAPDLPAEASPFANARRADGSVSMPGPRVFAV